MRRILTAIVGMALLAAPQAARASDEQNLVDQSATMMRTVQVGSSGTATNVRELLHSARGILIIPQLVKGGFILGAQGVMAFCSCEIHNRIPGVRQLFMRWAQAPLVSKLVLRCHRSLSSS